MAEPELLDLPTAEEEARFDAAMERLRVQMGLAPLFEEERKEFDPNQPRDESGKWTADGGEGAALRGQSAQKFPPASPGTVKLDPNNPKLSKLAALTTRSSYKVMAEALKEALPRAETRVDMDRFTKAEILPQIQALGQLAQDYPAAADKLVNVGAPFGAEQTQYQYREGYGALAFTMMGSDGQSSILFNTGFHKDDIPASAQSAESARPAYGGESPWGAHGTDQPGSTAVHEFGHSIMLQLQEGGTREQRHAALDFGWSEKLNDASSLSQYAAFSRNETFAEGFMAYYYGSDHPIAEAVGDFLKEMYGDAPRAR